MIIFNSLQKLGRYNNFKFITHPFYSIEHGIISENTLTYHAISNISKIGIILYVLY